MALPLPSDSDHIRSALELAYPGSHLDAAAGTFIALNGTTIPYVAARDLGPAAHLDGATLGDQFTYLYPLTFDLTQREEAFNDPGRLRNDAFFRALYGESEGEVRDTLVPVRFDGDRVSISFSATTLNCVDVQLAAALAELDTLSPAIDVYFDKSGGSFNWRVIAGTDRLSSHSFGAAIDLNTDLGGYWRWAGRPEGDAGPYDNKMPAELVEAFERYGFIWGGKWHHYDGMHFEYRPELILYARLAAE